MIFHTTCYVLGLYVSSRFVAYTSEENWKEKTTAKILAIAGKIDKQNQKNKLLFLEKISYKAKEANYIKDNFHRLYGRRLNDPKRKIIMNNLKMEFKLIDKFRKTGKINLTIIDMEEKKNALSLT